MLESQRASHFRLMITELSLNTLRSSLFAALPSFMIDYIDQKRWMHPQSLAQGLVHGKQQIFVN